MYHEFILLTIAARGGSKGVKDKNIRPLAGLPLIAYSVLQAIEWGKADKIVCTTDSKKIASIAKEYGADIPFMRPRKLANDIVGKIEVLRHCLKNVEDIYKKKFEIIVDLDVSAPIRKVSDIDNVVTLFKQKRPLSIFSVTRSRKSPYFNMVEKAEDGFYKLVKRNNSSLFLRRQDVPPVYDMNASIYVYNRKYLLDTNTRTAISNNSLIWIMDETSAFDIDTELDFQIVDFLISTNKINYITRILKNRK
jgi:CMP-N-acetylneuraminic acid synthetase